MQAISSNITNLLALTVSVIPTFIKVRTTRKEVINIGMSPTARLSNGSGCNIFITIYTTLLVHAIRTHSHIVKVMNFMFDVQQLVTWRVVIKVIEAKGRKKKSPRRKEVQIASFLPR
jgi:hypothetical protein